MNEPTTTLILGATGATGRLLTEQLLQMGQNVRVIVRSADRVPETWKDSVQVSIIEAGISEILEDEMSDYMKDCDAVASCLGHNGIYSKPRKLVTDAVDLICRSLMRTRPGKPAKILLMNTAGNRNQDLQEEVSPGQQIVVGLLRLLLPPHVDNEKAADYLRTNIGQKHDYIEWSVIRPDDLVNEDDVSPYTVHPSPVRSAIFNAGITSRINVGNFMARLIVDENVWNQWKGQMPVIYNKAP